MRVALKKNTTRKSVNKKRDSIKKFATKFKKIDHHSREKFKGFDSRCKDEIDELKIIFYKFFVPEANKDLSSLGRD